MGICLDCGIDMKETDTCTYNRILINGKWYQRNTQWYDINETCHDCGIKNNNGHIHHFGCDMEGCPVHPDRQFLTCCYPHTEALSSDRGLKIVKWEPRDNWLHGQARVK